jgi:hypothetical protein
MNKALRCILTIVECIFHETKRANLVLQNVVPSEKEVLIKDFDGRK